MTNTINIHGTITEDCTGLTLWGGEWHAPSKAWRRLCGAFGETLVRTIVCNSSRGFTPSNITEVDAQVIHQVCEAAKKEEAAK